MSEYAWVKLDNGREVYRRIRDDRVARSDMPCPMIISDQIEIKSMVDGQIYTSKRGLRQSYRENGYIEIGDQEQKMPPKPKPDRAGVRMAARKALSKVGISTG